MNKKFAVLAALATLSLAAIAPASAADNGFYLGAGVTKSEFDADDIDAVSLDDNSFKVIAGFRPLDWLAFEANYVDLGSDSQDFGPFTSDLEANAITLSALGILEVGVVDLYARAGVAHWNVDITNSNGFDDASADGDELTYGVGVGAHFGSVGVRAEWERFNVDDDNLGSDFDVNTVSLSFTYTFL